MSRIVARRTWTAVLQTGAGVVLVLWTAAALDPGARATTTRPIEEFVAAQGTYCLDDGNGGCVLFVPPLQNFFGWSTLAIPRCAAVDYAGIANAYIEATSGGTRSLGTRMDGTVTERPLADGRAEIDVLLHTTKALTWVIDGATISRTTIS